MQLAEFVVHRDAQRLEDAPAGCFPLRGRHHWRQGFPQRAGGGKVAARQASRQLTRRVDELCAEVRREAVALVDAFGIPPECLAAPIALD